MLGELALPGERVRDDGRQVVELRLPRERRPDAVGGGDDASRIAGPALGEVDLEVDARYALDGVDHLEHREAAAVAAIERRRRAAATQMGERIGMRAHQI